MSADQSLLKAFALRPGKKLPVTVGSNMGHCGSLPSVQAQRKFHHHLIS